MKHIKRDREPIIGPSLKLTIDDIAEAHEKLSGIVDADTIENVPVQTSGNIRWWQIYNDATVQILSVSRFGNGDEWMESHRHPGSLEIIIPIRGDMEMNDRIVSPGHPMVVQPGEPHRGRIRTVDFFAVIVIVPPEEAYISGKK
jgi:hypothetical protein